MNSNKFPHWPSTSAQSQQIDFSFYYSRYCAMQTKLQCYIPPSSFNIQQVFHLPLLNSHLIINTNLHRFFLVLQTVYSSIIMSHFIPLLHHSKRLVTMAIQFHIFTVSSSVTQAETFFPVLVGFIIISSSFQNNFSSEA